MSEITMNHPIWTPTQPEKTNLAKFMTFLSEKSGHSFADYYALHQYSIENIDIFWRSVIEFCGAEGDFAGPALLGEEMFACRWFPDAKINYAKTMLKRRDQAEAIVFRGEDRVEERLSFEELYLQVAKMQNFLRESGVVKGDRVAAFVPNHPAAVIGMLAAAAMGAVWSSCSPDFGNQGILDRFGQIEPKILIAVDGYYYAGKTHDCTKKIKEVLADLPSVKKVVIIEYANTYQSDIKNAVTFGEAIGNDAYEVHFEELAFDHPLFILYSSGTTGVPKCIVHGHGGTLLQHLKEHQLHSDIRPSDRVFYFSTCSWMMWNWLVSSLASGAALMLYDGSPFYPGPGVLWDYAEKDRFTFFGTSAKYLEALEKQGFIPKAGYDLTNLRAMASTGSPLSPEGYEFVYQAIKADIHLASISGGTDIVSCFVLGVPVLPVYKGEIQAPGLGMAVEVWNEDGAPIYSERGELVCCKPFPSRPVFFWNDPEREKYHAAYFERFDQTWTHGDFAEVTERGGIIIYGRSDATLNPGGVRIGTAEIYRQVDRVTSVAESIVIGQAWDNDVRVVLFVKMKEGLELSEEIEKEIKSTIRTNCTPRHVPAKIIAIPDIPRTKSGKIVEIPVRDVVHGREVKNKEALANPEALEFYKDIPDLQV